MDFRYSYVLGYAGPGEGMGKADIKRDRLNVHTDDSEVTLNVCLGVPGFKGGELAFNGLRSSKGEGEREAVVPHVLGQTGQLPSRARRSHAHTMRTPCARHDARVHAHTASASTK